MKVISSLKDRKKKARFGERAFSERLLKRVDAHFGGGVSQASDVALVISLVFQAVHIKIFSQKRC